MNGKKDSLKFILLAATLVLVFFASVEFYSMNMKVDKKVHIEKVYAEPGVKIIKAMPNAGDGGVSAFDDDIFYYNDKIYYNYNYD